MSNGPVVGQMHQGSPVKPSVFDNDDASDAVTPSRAKPAGPVPRGEQHQKETPGLVGRNTNKPR